MHCKMENKVKNVFLSEDSIAVRGIKRNVPKRQNTHKHTQKYKTLQQQNTPHQHCKLSTQHKNKQLPCDHFINVVHLHATLQKGQGQQDLYGHVQFRRSTLP